MQEQERRIQARYEGTCTQCRGAVRCGDWVYWSPSTRAVRHADCDAARARHERLAAEQAWADARRAQRERMKALAAELKAAQQAQAPQSEPTPQPRRPQVDRRWERMSYSQRVAYARALNARHWARVNRESMPEWYVYEKDAK